MNGSNEVRHRARQLAVDSQAARSRARAARDRAVLAARAAADAHDEAAAIMDRLADLQPGDAARLRSLSASARARAARRRQRPEDDLPRPVPGADDPAMIVLGERDRIGAELHDTVVRRVFAVGLILQSAAGLTKQQEVRSRIDEAVDELDDVVHEIRQAVFLGGRHRPGGRQEIAELAARLAPAAEIRFSGPPADGQDPARDARLRDSLHQALALIGEYATPTSIGITAGGSFHDLVIEAACLSPAGEPSRWLAGLRTRAARAGFRVDSRPESRTLTVRSRVRGRLHVSS